MPLSFELPPRRSATVARRKSRTCDALFQPGSYTVAELRRHLELPQSGSDGNPGIVPTAQTVRGPGVPWHALAFELGRTTRLAPPKGLVRALSMRLPAGTEFTVATQRLRAELSFKSATPSQWLTPEHLFAAPQGLREVRTFLFLRVPGAVDAAQVSREVEHLVRVCDLAVSALPLAQALAVLQRWSSAASVNDGDSSAIKYSSDSTPNVSHSCVHATPHPAYPTSAAEHPLQRGKFLTPQERLALAQVETLECTHFQLVDADGRKPPLSQMLKAPLFASKHVKQQRAKDRQSFERDWALGEPFASVRTSTIIRGAASAVEEATALYASNLRAGGFASMPASASLSGALPWLSPVVPERRVARTLRMLPRGMAHADLWLPLPHGAESGLYESKASENLRVRDTQEQPVCLDLKAFRGGSNVLLMGCAGSGRTTLANALMAAHLDAGGWGWNLGCQDNSVFADAHDTAEIHLTLDAPMSINPLWGLSTPETFYREEDVLCAWLLALSGKDDLPREEFSDTERIRLTTALESALSRAWQAHGPRLGLGAVLSALEHCEVGDVLAGLQYATDIRARLAGLDPLWFEGPSKLKSDSAYLSVNLSQVRTELAYTTLTHTLVALASREIAQRSPYESKMVTLDEVGLMGSRGASTLVRNALRRTRKHNATFVCTSNGIPAETASQSPHEEALDMGSPNKLLLNDVRNCTQLWLLRMGAVHEVYPYRTHSGAEFIWYNQTTGLSVLLELRPEPALLSLLGPIHAETQRYWAARRAGASADQALATCRQAPKLAE